MKKYLLAGLMCVIVASFANAQFRASNRLSFESNVGFSMSHTDIAPSGIGVSMQFGGVYSLLRSMGVGFGINYSSLGSRVDKYDRQFKSTVIGFQVDYHINIPQLLTDYPQSFPVSPYIRIGAGYDIAQPTLVDYGQVNEIPEAKDIYPIPEKTIMSQSYRTVTVPTTIGAFFRLNSYADINFKLNYVYADSDMLDGHEPITIGNKYNDSYTMIMIGVRMKSWDRRRPHITGR